MRIMFAATALLTLAACGPSADVPSPPAEAAAVEQTAATPPTFTLETEAVVGQWSFDRTCGLYDLVFYADANVDYFDYSNESQVVSYGGQWTEDRANNRVTLALHRLDAQGHVTGDPTQYTLDITAPVTDELTGRFGQGAQARDINARRCPQEDRE
jgi:hypothetical protein